MTSKNNSIPSSCLQKFLPSPFSLQKVLRPPKNPLPPHPPPLLVVHIINAVLIYNFASIKFRDFRNLGKIRVVQSCFISYSTDKSQLRVFALILSISLTATLSLSESSTVVNWFFKLSLVKSSNNLPSVDSS